MIAIQCFSSGNPHHICLFAHVAAYQLKKSQLDGKSSVLISTSGVKELEDFRLGDDEVFIGAQTSMTKLENIFTELSTKLPGECRTL